MESSVDHKSRFARLTDLSAEKLQQLETILKSILATPLAQKTFAQIIDGNPTDSQSDPSNEAIQQYKQIRESFTVQALKVDTHVNWPFILSSHISLADFDKAGPRLPESVVG